MSFYTLIFNKDMSSKKASLMILFSTIILSISIIAVNFIVDPYQFFHKSLFDQAFFSKKQRYQTPGIIKNYRADNYLVGTSMSENFSGREAEKIFGNGAFRQITISGMKPKEYSTILKYIIKHGHPKTIFIDIHWYFESLKTGIKNEQFDFPTYLYSESWLEQFKYLANHDVFMNSMRLMFGDIQEEFSSDLDTLNFWMEEDDFEEYNSVENLQTLKSELRSYFKTYNAKTIIESNYKYPNIDKYLKPIFLRHPKIKFILFFPPYSTWYYAASKSREFGRRLIYLRKYVADIANSFKNVEVHGFDLEFDIVNDLRNYKDILIIIK